MLILSFWVCPSSLHSRREQLRHSQRARPDLHLPEFLRHGVRRLEALPRRPHLHALGNHLAPHNRVHDAAAVCEGALLNVAETPETSFGDARAFLVAKGQGLSESLPRRSTLKLVASGCQDCPEMHVLHDGGFL